MPLTLERELKAFERELPRLLNVEGCRGRYALVHGDQVDSVWETREKALEECYQRFGLELFLVKEITDHEEPRFFSRNVTRCRS
jgi:hypothetical protein